ncbi:DUF7504 family protein [Haloplanus ruber]|uniref:KaiC-like domain-containing protein n=1 Tax=Haloplanus ruber TaxID=869892 RepID=A0ABD6D2U7_9EURY|nr:hypothetical protein [Haloplanus ruber]
MVYRFQCRRCPFTVWSTRRDAIADAAGSHILSHYRERVTKQDFRIRWSCPHCERSGQHHDGDAGVERFEQHLFEHVESSVESGVHVADDIDRTGGVLVRAPRGSTGLDNARVHFLSPGGVVLFVTTAPAERIRLLDDALNEWPARTIILTTKPDPLGDISELDLSAASLEVVRLDSRLGLSEVGETISRVVGEYEDVGGKIVAAFDILPELVEKFDLQTVFKFLHVLDTRLTRADALSHYHVDPRTQSQSTINVLGQAFDLSIVADDRRFVAGE